MEYIFKEIQFLQQAAVDPTWVIFQTWNWFVTYSWYMLILFTVSVTDITAVACFRSTTSSPWWDGEWASQGLNIGSVATPGGVRGWVRGAGGQMSSSAGGEWLDTGRQGQVYMLTVCTLYTHSIHTMYAHCMNTVYALYALYTQVCTYDLVHTNLYGLHVTLVDSLNHDDQLMSSF